LRRMREAALALLTVLLLAACGGGGGSSRLSKSEFDAKANDICDKYLGEIDAVPAPKEIKDVPAYIDKVLPLIEEATSKLDDLQPPKDIEPTVDEWIRLQRKQVDQGKQLKAAAEKGDTATAAKVVNEGNATNKRGNELAKEMGATACEQD
jgi:hypothetical protein